MRFRTAVLWNGISQFGQSGINFLSIVILAHLLTPDDFAIIGIVTIFVMFSYMAVDSEMGGALLRKKTVTRIDYSTLFYYNLGVSFLLYGLMYLGAPLIARFYHQRELTDVVRVIGLATIIHAFRVVPRVILFRDLRFKTYAIINVVAGLVSLAAAIWLAKRGYGYWALVWQQVVLAIAHVVLMELYTRFVPLLRFSRESFHYQFSFGISLLVSNTIRTIANNIATNIIGKISSMNFTGYFTQSSKLTNFCQSSLATILDQGVFPILAKYERIEDIQSVYYRILRLLTLALAGVTVVFVVFATPIIRIVLGEQWVAGADILRILSLTIIPTSIQVLTRNILKTLGSTRRILYLETFKSVLIILMLLGAAFINTYLVVWSLVVSQGVSCIVFLIYTGKELRRDDIRLG